MASGQWEVVGSSKKHRSTNGANQIDKSKNQLKTNIKVEEKATIHPRDVSRNLQKFKINLNLDEVNDKYEFKEETVVVPSSKPTHRTTSKKTTPARPKTLKEAITKLNLSELQGLSKVLRKQFLNNPLVWLKDIAAFLNVKLNPSTPVDSAYRQEGGPNAPLDYLTLPIKEFLTVMVQGTSVDVLAQFHRHCFTSMLHEAMKGLPVHGYAIFIQILGNVCKEASTVYSKDYLPLREMYDSHPRPGLTYVWLLSHTVNMAAIAKQCDVAVNLWIEGLVPLLGSKHYSALVAKCGKDLVNKFEFLQRTVSASANKDNISSKKVANAKPKGASSKNALPMIISAEQLLNLMDITYLPNTQIPRPINKQLIDIFNKLRLVCTHPELDGSSKQTLILFQKLLPKISTSSTTVSLAQQIKTICAYCIDNNETAVLDTWSKLLPNNLASSSKFLRLLAEDEELNRVLTTPGVNKVLKDFEQATATSVSQDISAKEFNREVKKVLNNLPVGSRNKAAQSRNKSEYSPGGLYMLAKFFFWTVAFFACMGVYCVSVNKNKKHFDTTVIGRFAHAVGYENQIQELVHHTAILTNQSARQLKTLQKHAVDIVGPYIGVLYAHSMDFLQWVKSSTPGAVEAVKDATLMAWQSLQPYYTSATSAITSMFTS